MFLSASHFFDVSHIIEFDFFYHVTYNSFFSIGQILFFYFFRSFFTTSTESDLFFSPFLSPGFFGQSITCIFRSRDVTTCKKSKNTDQNFFIIVFLLFSHVSCTNVNSFNVLLL